MLFNSLAYAVFLPVVLLIYYSLAHRAQNVFLLAASYVFYGWWDWRFLILVWISTLLDFGCSLGIESTRSPRLRRAFVLTAVTGNLCMIGAFKYFNFFADSLAALAAAAGFHIDAITLRVALPVGISFYTFQTMSYTIDVYRGRIRAVRNPVDFALYVTFFPQLVAGPIERASTLIPQIQSRRIVRHEQLASGMFLILLGLFKKMVIADNAAPLVERVFSDPAACSAGQLLGGLYAFSAQIYCDFSGYSDIARGSAHLLGFELTENFQQPYLARNITDFWRRWHVTLSSWLRDYLYIPLGGNRHGTLMTYRNLMLTMLLGGLWHGANWNFVVWGLWHGAGLGAMRLWKAAFPNVPDTPIVRALGVAVTVQFVCFGWVLFAAPDLPTAIQALRRMVG